MKIRDMVNMVDIVELAKQKHKLVRAGSTYRINPCPICNGNDHFTIYPESNSYNSFNDCCNGGTVYDYLMEVERMDKNQAYNELLILTGKEDMKKDPTISKPTKAEITESNHKYTNTIIQLYNKQSEEDKQYFRDRGLSDEIIERYKLSVGDIKELDSQYYGKRAIIPVWHKNEAVYWNSRAIEDDNKIKYMKARGNSTYFNIDHLENAAANERIVICEGEFDALSLEDVGIKAIAIGGVGNYENFIKEVKRKDILFLTGFDNSVTDDSKHGEHRLEIPSKFDDLNEWYVNDRESFKKGTKAQIKATKRPDSLYNYMRDKFSQEILQYKKFKDKKTGFSNLDKETSLYPGLYAIGGISTLGKTTFIHQMADQLAQKGEHIIFFSLEMSKLELITKSLARLTALDDTGVDFSRAINSLDIRMDNMTSNQKQRLTEAIDKYEDISQRFNIVEGNFDTNIFTIIQYVREYIKINKVKPVVIIDYLQIVQGDPNSWSGKDELDGVVTGLKQLSRDYNIAVIAVSSFNRSNYMTPVDFESFNGSGNIEYTADVVWGLQLQAIHDDIFNSNNKIKEKRELINEAKKAIPRKIELSCMKNRNGRSNYSCNFIYRPDFDYFESEDSTDSFGNNNPTPVRSV